MDSILEQMNTGQKACIALAGVSILGLSVGAFQPKLVLSQMFELTFMLSIPLYIVFENQNKEPVDQWNM